MKSLLVGIKNVLLWSYARGTWQYDVLCGLIVLTLLVWPNSTPKRATAAVTSTTQAYIASGSASNAPSLTEGILEYEIEWQTLRAFLQEQGKLELLNSPREAAVLFLQNEGKKAVMLVALEPFGDAQGRRGYRVRYRAN